MTRLPLHEFVEPNWRAPLDLQKALNAVPDSATITGMFLEPSAREARRLGKPLPSARDRYVAFRFYPLREHVQLIIEACALLYPGRPARVALRSLGRAAPSALLTSTLGRATVGVAQGTHAIVEAMAKSYSVNMPGAKVVLVEQTPQSCLVRMQNVPFFLDCHHVGVFEGVLRYAGVEGGVRIRSFGPNDADLLCAWQR